MKSIKTTNCLKTFKITISHIHKILIKETLKITFLKFNGCDSETILRGRFK